MNEKIIWNIKFVWLFFILIIISFGVILGVYFVFFSYNEDLYSSPENYEIGQDYKDIEVKLGFFGFKPSSISVKQGEIVMLSFVNVDDDFEVIIPDFGVKGKENVEFLADIKGEFQFKCINGCGRWNKGLFGKIIVE